eukprot:382749-Pyramimonas_sp.AAC.1
MKSRDDVDDFGSAIILTGVLRGCLGAQRGPFPQRPGLGAGLGLSGALSAGLSGSYGSCL